MILFKYKTKLLKNIGMSFEIDEADCKVLKMTTVRIDFIRGELNVEDLEYVKWIIHLVSGQ